MTIHIGVSGPIASGKSTLSNGLAAILNLIQKNTVVIPFASGLKELALLYSDPDRVKKACDYFIGLGYSKDRASSGAFELNNAFELYPIIEGTKPRKLYQYIGTEIGRDVVDKDIWIRDVQQRTLRRGNNLNFVISDDMRFVNESYAVQVHVQLVATNALSKGILDVRRNLLPVEYLFDNHASEKERPLMRVPDYQLEVAYTPTDLVNLALDLTQ